MQTETHSILKQFLLSLVMPIGTQYLQIMCLERGKLLVETWH